MTDLRQKEPVYIEIDNYGDKRYYSDREMTVRHRADGPAIEYADGTKAWYTNGQRHRSDGPAVVTSTSKEWWQYNMLHRLDGPAIEWFDGSKEWWQNGMLHRSDGPAVEWADGTKTWWQNDQRHRLDGPAVEEADGYKRWYIDGKHLTEAEFLAATAPKVVHEMTLDDIADRLGLTVESSKIVK